MITTSSDAQQFRHPNFLPFVGQRYGAESDWKLPILILGESYPVDNASYAEYTRENVEEYMDGEWTTPFMTKLFQLFNGHRPTVEQRRRFWEQVAYTVFVQERIAGPRIRPTKEQWQHAIPAFEEVCSALKPRLILAVGSDTWNNLPAHTESGPDLRLPDGQVRPTSVYSFHGFRTLTFGIDHPSSFGWRYRTWTPWVQAALTAARSFE